MPSLIDTYAKIESSISVRLHEFEQLGSGKSFDIWCEMIYCTCTPQTNAKHANAAVEKLKALDLADHGYVEDMATVLRDCGVRFHKNKAKYIDINRTKYKDLGDWIHGFIKQHDVLYTRNWLADHISGWGYKEASHFLRNIGYGEEICILDRHILRCLEEHEVIDSIPKNLNSSYMEIEQKMLEFSRQLGIPNAAMDLLFWYTQKGEIYK
jgi:N-glycosylase/DNA lyase